ncbi:ATP-binding protein [Rhodobacter calidifons]|uniref:histidine kinase n=1 Tax=Rhodobacter calidifons TaxID=2715277 RepID=A0ABX0G230_9RHOB|nr:ATP-binding protein [Rhodobacter calidifons]NHB75186.1 response regulator [Rhodobacter calidifons]
MPKLPSPSIAEAERVRDELARQYRILRGEFLPRLILVALAYVLCSLFIPPALAAALFCVEIIGEIVSQRLLRGLDPARQPGRHLAYLATLIPMEAAIISAAGMLWLHDDPYAKAISVGIVMGALLHLTSVRSIHLPLGIVGLISAGAVVLGFNTWHWIAGGNWIALGISTLTVLVTFGYTATAMISNNRMHRAGVEAAAAARAANVAKGRFLAQISHELRTPLNAVIGLGEIEAASASGPSRQRLRTIVTSARDLAVMLDDAVDYSALTEGRVAITPRPVAVRAELSANLLVFELQARNQGRDLVVTVERDVPTHLLIDSQRVRQCLGNLVGNALKHSARGPVSVTVRYMRSRLVIDVADQGRGIPEALREKVFEPFFRGSSETPGVGLGLAISRAVARQMSGDLVILPTAQGTTMRLTVLAPEAEAVPQQRELSDLRDCTVLVVDDIATNRLVAGQLLTAIGARFIEAASGPEALQRLEQGGVDAVLLDLMMPGMDGAETLQHIRARHGQRIPVIAMTADILAVREDEALRAALDGFLPKPILPEALREALARVMPGR